jgi:hypothetical protein
MPEPVGTIYNEDKTGHRTGWVLEEDITDTILKGVIEAKEYISVKYTEQKKVTKISDLFNLIDILKAGVMIGYPSYYGLPEWEPCKVILEEKDDIINKEDNNTDV